MKTHPYAEILPEMTADEFDALCADIKQHGQREPIRTWNNMIIDGRHRFRACQKLKLKPTLLSYRKDDILEFIRSSNIHRRHLTTSQRAIVAAQMAAIPGQTPSNDVSGSVPIGTLVESEAVTQKEAAEVMNVPVRSVRRGAEVVNKGTPELVEAVKNKDISVSRAAEISRLPKEEQQEAIEQPPPKKKPVPFDKKIMKNKIGKIAFEVAALQECCPEEKDICDKILNLCRDAQEYLGV